MVVNVGMSLDSARWAARRSQSVVLSLEVRLVISMRMGVRAMRARWASTVAEGVPSSDELAEGAVELVALVLRQW